MVVLTDGEDSGSPLGLKALMAVATGDEQWRHTAPPLQPLSAEGTAALLRKARATGTLGDDWPGLHPAAAQ